MTKMCLHISASVQKLYLSTFVLFRNVCLCFLFLILESILKRSLSISYAAGGYNSTGLSVSLLLNHRSFVQDRETSASDITRVKNPEEVLTC